MTKSIKEYDLLLKVVESAKLVVDHPVLNRLMELEVALDELEEYQKK